MTNTLVVTQANEMMFQEERGISVKTIQAVQALREAKIPANMIQTHPGKGGKTFSYLSHIYATELVINALDQFYSMDVLEARMCSDGTAYARVQFQVHVPMTQPDGTITFFTNSITEVGAFEGSGKMPEAFMLASAASRGFVKCLMRRFGLGKELYQSDVQITPKEAWSSLWAFVENQLGKPANKDASTVRRGEMVNLLKGANISSENLVDKFQDAYSLIHEWVKAKKDGGTHTEAPAMTEPNEEPEEPAEKETKEEPPKTEEPKAEEPVRPALTLEKDGLYGPPSAAVKIGEGWLAFYKLMVEHLGFDDSNNYAKCKATIKRVTGGDKELLIPAVVWELLRQEVTDRLSKAA